ncbi:MAG: hypothetical protein ABMA02_13095 [Saprospiraceae bacterium]
MNNFRFLSLTLIAAAIGTLALASCKKDPEEIQALISDSEAAEIVETAVSGRSAGTTMTTEDMAEMLATTLACGVPGDTTLQHTGTPGPVTCTGTFEIGWLVTCSNLGVPQSAQFDLDGTTSFTASRWSGTGTGAGSLTATGLNPSATAYVFDGSYTSGRQLTGNLRKVDPTITTSTEITLTDLTIRKSDKMITGGTATVIVTATAANGGTRTVNGSLVFNGNGTATVTVNGYSHTFQL